CVIKPRVQCIKWHKPQPKYFKLWERLIKRVTANTRVCSNHFVHGKPMGEHPHPELWLRGYGTDKETLNHNSWNDVDEQSDVFITKSKKTCNIDNRKESAESLSSISEAMKNDHTYSMYEQSGACMEEFGCQTRLCLKCRKEIMNILEENERLKNESEQLQKSLTEANQ
ncbi:hypothetical protein P5673_025047, partial [Acropora cervicornis]